MEIRELRAVIDLGSLETFKLWFVDDDGNEHPVADAAIDFDRRRLIMKGETT